MFALIFPVIEAARVVYQFPCVFPSFFLLAGASPLGEMPSAGEVASLGFATTGAGEDPLSSTLSTEATTGIRTIPGLQDSLSTSGPLSGNPAASTNTSGSTSVQGFSLGHGFPLIPAEMVAIILKWESINMSELLPDNLELAHHPVVYRGAEIMYHSKVSQKARAV